MRILRTRTRLESIGVFGVFLAEAVFLQVLGGTYSDGFGGTPDEAAHFITSLMVRDFLAGGDFWHPLTYAQEYYLHYPKVAIGHWPPVLYGLLGTWMLIFGTSRVAVMQFFSMVVAALGYVIYFSGRALVGRAGGLFAGLLYIALPLAQESSNRVMTEHVVTLFMLVSTLQFANFAQTARSKDGLLFGVIAALAILNRGSAWALGLVPVGVIVLTRSFGLVRRVGLWLSAVPVLATCVPWYLWTHNMSEGAWVGDSLGTPFFLQALTLFPLIIISSLGFVLLLPSILGVVVHILWRWKDRNVDPTWAGLAALMFATFTIHCVIPASIEPRFMVTIMPPLLLFATAGIIELSTHIPSIKHAPAFGCILLLVFATGFFRETFEVPGRNRNRGYETVARELKEHSSVNPQVYLIVSDSRGEGGMIAAISVKEKRPGSIILRGSKIFVDEDWLGRMAENRFHTVADITCLFDRIPINFVVLDDTVPLANRRPYHDKVRSVVTRDTRTWEVMGIYPLIRGNHEYKEGLHIYARRSLRSQTTPMKADLDLIRHLTFRKHLQ